MELLPQAVTDGVMLGAIYITIAVAFSLVYGVMHVIDFAVGEWIMFGAFAGFYLNRATGIDPFALLPAVFVVFAALGWVLQPLIQRVLSGKRGNPLLMGLVFTFGLSLMFRGLAQTFFGFYSLSTPSRLSNGSFFFEKGRFFLTVSHVRLAGLAYAIAITAALQYLLKHTDFGLGVRALAQHKDAAGLMGVNNRRTSAFVYAIYVGISAMTGVLIGTIFSVSAKMGPEYTIFAFFVVVLAGMGYLAGVPAAAFLLGIIQSLFLIYLDPGYTLLAVFGVLYLILLASPTGLFRKGV
ncbi:MAG TPA: branched-chain amino acid ABC transporter permease [Anaeromyxobacter sp.]